MSPGMTTGRGGQGSRQGSRPGGVGTGAVRPGAAGARSGEPGATDAGRDARPARERTDPRAPTKPVVQDRRGARAARRAEGDRSGETEGATG